MSLGERVKELMEEKGWSEGELARRAGLRQPTVHRIITGESKDPRHGNLEKLAFTLGSTTEWLRRGKGKKDRISKHNSPGGDGSVEPAPNMTGTVPLLSWVQAGAWMEVSNVVETHDVAEQYPAPPNCGPNTFVLRVRGESMIERYQPGAIIYVDPDVEWRSGDDVIVQCEEHGGAEATFKRLIIEPGEKMLLKALNSAWREQYIDFTPDCRIIGVVIAQMIVNSR